MNVESDHTLTHTTTPRDRHPCSLRDSKPQSQQEDADQCLKPRCHQSRHENILPMSDTSTFKPEIAELQTHKTKFMCAWQKYTELFF